MGHYSETLLATACTLQLGPFTRYCRLGCSKDFWHNHVYIQDESPPCRISLPFFSILPLTTTTARPKRAATHHESLHFLCDLALPIPLP